MKPSQSDVRDARLARARLALDGLSVGDAFGERFFVNEEDALRAIAERMLPPGPWPTTDDTEMAISVLAALDRSGRIDRDGLARRLAARYAADPSRGYGGTAHGILRAIGAGEHWSVVAPRVFSGMGSMGNGAAARVAPLGAYFADDIDALVVEAAASAAPTHANEEAVAGAIAVAAASAYACRLHESSGGTDAGDLLAFAHSVTPPTETRRAIATAMALGPDASIQFAASVLGTGRRLSAPDTVPFALWCANRHLGSYEDALWTTVSGMGDRDTTCAIVGGIVALRVGEVPTAWIAAREPLRLGCR